MSDGRILVVDDEESMRFFVRRGLRRHGYEVVVAADGAQALDAFAQHGTDAAVLDLRMPGIHGFELLDRLRAADPDLPVIVMTAHGTVENAVEALRRGAFDFITKPFEIAELRLALGRALQRRVSRGPATAVAPEVELIGSSAAMRELRAAIEQLAASDATVLVRGESGTGKELVARRLHEQSARSAKPFVALHCAALPDTLLESELFGHVAGAFTGAHDAKGGKLTRAAGGTLFLDEVIEMGHPAQIRLERFLETRVVVPLGSADGHTVDARVVAAANRDPEVAVADGTLRRQLYYRLNVVPLHVPPLRERRDDVPALAEHFARSAAEQLALPAPAFTPAAQRQLAQWPWPGNVRELQNVVARMVVLNQGVEVLDIGELPEEYRGLPPAIDGAGDASIDASAQGYQQAVTGFERAYLEDLFRRTHGNVSEAARMAGLSRGHLHRKARQLGVEPDQFR